VGGLFAGLLARAGIEVALVARGQTHQVLQTEGLRVTSPLGDFTIRPVVASADPTSLGRADVVMVTVKAWQVSEVAPRLLPLLKPDTVVIPVQN